MVIFKFTDSDVNELILEGAAMMGAVPYKYKPSPGVLYAQTGVTSPPPPAAPAPEPPLLPGQNQELLL